MVNYGEILRYFPYKVGASIDRELKKDESNCLTLEEIRLRVGRPIILKFGTRESVLGGIIELEDILETLQHICDNSIYSYQNQICNGFITVKGGHRVGITGSGVMTEGKVSNLNYISHLNFRIARQVIGCSNRILKYILDVENNTIYNTLLISPPGAGKTTLLRDLLRKISDGMEQVPFSGKTVGIVDERGEIAAMHRGVPQNDVGTRTDVIDNLPKALGMAMLIRSMSPDIISADEIGNLEDVKAIEYAVCCGIKGIFTAHGGNLEEIKMNPAISSLIENHVFERLLFLNKKKRGEIEKAYSLNKMTGDYILL